MKWLRRLAAIVILAGAIAALWFAYVPLRDYHEQHQSNYAQHKQNPSDPFTSIVTSVELHHDLWIVLETLALVFFTATLWFSTRRLQRTTADHAEHLESTARAAKLTAEVAASADSPIVLVDRWSASFANSGSKPSFRYVRGSATLQNFGRTPAFVVKQCIAMKMTYVLPDEPDWSRAFDIPYGQRTILPQMTYDLGEAYLLEKITPELETEIINEKKWVWIYGYVLYYDFLGTRWQYRFCARWYPPLRPIREESAFLMTGPANYSYRGYRRKGDDEYTDAAPRSLD